MAAVVVDAGVPAPAAADGRLSFSGIFLAAFVVFLLIALLAQPAKLPWRSWLPGAEGEKSLVGGVRAAVYTFMSHLS